MSKKLIGTQNIFPDHANKIAGVWKCLTFDILTDGKVVHKPHGDEPLGLVVLTRNGYLSAQMYVPALMEGFKKFGEQWRETKSDTEVAKAARGFAAYCGYLQLYEDADTKQLWWETKCDISIDPNRIGRLEKRKVKYFEEGGKAYMVLEPFGDELTPFAEHTKAVLKWVKIDSV